MPQIQFPFYGKQGCAVLIRRIVSTSEDVQYRGLKVNVLYSDPRKLGCLWELIDDFNDYDDDDWERF